MIASLFLAAGLGGLEPPVQADLKCVAVFAMIAGNIAGNGDAESQKNQAGLVGGMMYYLGRLEARRPDIDLQAGLTELLTSTNFASQAPQEAVRCGTELHAKGTALIAIGRALKALGTTPPAPAK